MSKQVNNVKRVSISRGNVKMGAIPSVSLPPIKTCPAGCPCAKKCYAAKICRLRPNVRQCYENNLELYYSAPARYWDGVRKAAKMTRYFRFHVSGDIVDGLYFFDMVITAEMNPETQFLAFTKKYDIVNEYMDRHNGELPGNLHVIFSRWDPAWNAKIRNPHGLPTSAVIFRGENGDEYDKICPGNCFECACKGVGCWTLEKGETIAFYEH